MWQRDLRPLCWISTVAKPRADGSSKGYYYGRRQMNSMVDDEQWTIQVRGLNGRGGASEESIKTGSDSRQDQVNQGRLWGSDWARRRDQEVSSCQIPAGHLIHKGHQYGCVRTSEQIQRKTSSSNSLRTYKPILRLTQLPFLLEEKWVNIQKNWKFNQ